MMVLSGGFVFRRGNSVYHRLDPRAKLLISALLFVAALLPPAGPQQVAPRSILELSLVMGLMLCIAAVAKVLGRVGRTMLLTATFSALIFVINFAFTGSLATSALYAIRFVAIVVSTSLFFITTSPDELEQVMKTFRVPRDVVFAFVTAVRFIPVMMLDALQIMDAQKARGLELEKGNLIRRVRNMIPVLIPLVVNAVVRSGELAEAMESRAYGAVAKPTALVEYKSTEGDRVVAAEAVLFFLGAVYSFYFAIPALWP